MSLIFKVWSKKYVCTTIIGRVCSDEIAGVPCQCNRQDPAVVRFSQGVEYTTNTLQTMTFSLMTRLSPSRTCTGREWEERVLWFLSGLQHDVERRWWQRRRRRRDNITRRPQHVFLLSMRTLLDILRISYFTNRRIAREDKENELCHSNDIVRVWSVSFNVSSDGGPK